MKFKMQIHHSTSYRCNIGVQIYNKNLKKAIFMHLPYIFLQKYGREQTKKGRQFAAGLDQIFVEIIIQPQFSG